MTYKQRCEQWAKAGGHHFNSWPARGKSKWAAGLATMNRKAPQMDMLTMSGTDEEDASHRLWDLLVAMGLTAVGYIQGAKRG